MFPLDVKAGDSILFGKYSGTEIKLDGEEFLIMREEEVLGILKRRSNRVARCRSSCRRHTVWSLRAQLDLIAELTCTDN